MNINDLAPARGAKKSVKRVGRGIGSGMGKTSTRGHKGQWARSGGGVRIGFEGGQMPMTRRMPKVGFNNHFKKEYNVINVGLLQNSEAIADGSVVTLEVLVEAGLVNKVCAYGLKVLGNGELTKKLTVKAAKFSEGAKAAIENAGGTVEVL
ncbi:MAG: 50S ribosomal protein L15 [Clostridia bacterium]|nr:50S ribosomal protein L15 [Clostridia bacterium]